MSYENQNLVMNKPQIFLNLKCGLSWISDIEMRQLMKKYFYFQECVYPDLEAMEIVLQNKADLIRDYYNKLYETTKYEYNPIENYRMVEEGTTHNEGSSSQSGNSQADNYGYPMENGEQQRPESKQVASSTGNGSGVADGSHTLTRSGNIGVTTSQQMIQSEREIILNLKAMYIKEFDDCFMLSI